MHSKHSKEYEVFLVGRYFCDLVFTDLPEMPRLGHEVYSKTFHLIPGGVYNAAIALHRLGVRTAWPCAFGNDPFSQFVRSEAEKEGVDRNFFEDVDKPSLHLTAAFSFDGERAFLSYSDPLPKYAYSDLIRETRPKLVYITHGVVSEELDGLAGAARAVGAKVFMDCQAHNFSIKDAVIQDALGKVDIFTPNRAEAEMLAGTTDSDEMLKSLLRFAPAVAIKDGAGGSYYADNKQHIHVPAIPVDAVDTTGAGDNFDSGFLYGLLRGKSIRECLLIGNYCGGMSAKGYGGTSTSPGEKELLAFLND